MNITTEQIEELVEQHREELFENGFVELFSNDTATVRAVVPDKWWYEHEYEFTVQDNIDGRECTTADASVAAHVLNLFLE